MACHRCNLPDTWPDYLVRRDIQELAARDRQDLWPVARHYRYMREMREMRESHADARTNAGATLMAMGTSSPELFTAVIGLFFEHDDIAVSTVVGSGSIRRARLLAATGLARSFRRHTTRSHLQHSRHHRTGGHLVVQHQGLAARLETGVSRRGRQCHRLLVSAVGLQRQ